MYIPAIHGLGPLVVVVGGPPPILAEGPGCSSPPFLAGVCCQCSWVVHPPFRLRALGAVPRHSWLGSAGGGGGCRCWCGAVNRGSCVFLVRSVCVRVLWCVVWCSWSLLWCFWCVFVRVGGLCVPAACVGFWACGGHGWALGAVVPGHSWLGSAVGAGGWSLTNPGWGPLVQLPAIPGWRLLVVLVVGGPSPFLADGPGGSSPPFLAGICCWWLWVVPCQFWLGALGAVPRHFWLGSACGGGVVAGVGLGCVVLRVCLWRAACVFVFCGVWCAALGPFCGALGVCVCVGGLDGLGRGLRVQFPAIPG